MKLSSLACKNSICSEQCVILKDHVMMLNIVVLLHYMILCFRSTDQDVNPFRPDGDLSQEADDVVEAIKLGRPLSPTGVEVPPLEQEITRTEVSNVNATPSSEEKRPAGQDEVDEPQTNLHDANFVINSQPVKLEKPLNQEEGQTAEVQAAIVVPPSDGAAQVEHVTIEKKKKCCAGCAIL